ncbi:MAG: helix-hairpin-helix domain-containing protein [Clostridia bacterium]|nr:helix-hairpin-helix domain-containing protein [Clostridia bacterium]
MNKLDISHKILLLCVFAFIIYIAAGSVMSSFDFKRTDVSDSQPLRVIEESALEETPEGEPVNINTAGKYELERLPGVSEATADKIIAYREEFGPFETPEEIMLVSGIGEKKYEAMSEFIYVE